MVVITVNGVDIDLDQLNYIVKFPYNGTIATGGDSLTQNLNIWYEVRLDFFFWCGTDTQRPGLCSW